MAYKILALHIDYQYMKAPGLSPSATVSVLLETGPLRCKAVYKRYSTFYWANGSLPALEESVATTGVMYAREKAMALFGDKIEGVREYGDG